VTTTDALKTAVCKALEQRRPQLDAGLPLVSVSLIVRLDRKTGRPRELIYRTEESQDVRCGVPPDHPTCES
jgi:hypothetical protein